MYKVVLAVIALVSCLAFIGLYNMGGGGFLLRVILVLAVMLLAPMALIAIYEFITGIPDAIKKKKKDK